MLSRSCNRALLDEFADVERISVEEARIALRSALRTFDDMNSFMTLCSQNAKACNCPCFYEGPLAKY